MCETDANTMMEKRRIALAQPSLDGREHEYVMQVLASGVLALGPFAETFEAEVARLAGRRFGIACSSGTAGLHMVVRALGISRDDEVITTPFSFVASASCIAFEGARPRFVDIEEESLGLDPDRVAATRGDRIKGILPVHVFGQPCRIDELVRIAGERGWRLIEDACEALGSSSRGVPMGSYGDASVFAFYPNKQITTGEGGMVVTDDPALAGVFRSLRNQGRDDDGTWLRHVRLGFNYRMDELSAAIGVAQLERLAELREGRRRVARAYEAALKDVSFVRLPVGRAEDDVDWFVFVIRLDPSIDRKLLIDQLESVGVPTRPYFSPLHLEPVFADLGHRRGDFPVAERVAASTLALPFSARLSETDVAYVCEALVASVGTQPRS